MDGWYFQYDKDSLLKDSYSSLLPFLGVMPWLKKQLRPVLGGISEFWETFYCSMFFLPSSLSW